MWCVLYATYGCTLAVDQCSNRQQLLYPICSGIDNNSLMKCNGTVLDIFSDTSLCSQHSSETAANASFRKKALYLQSRAAHKKVKLGVAKVVRDRKGQVKVSSESRICCQQYSTVKPVLVFRWSETTSCPNGPLFN